MRVDRDDRVGSVVTGHRRQPDGGLSLEAPDLEDRAGLRSDGGRQGQKTTLPLGQKSGRGAHASPGGIGDVGKVGGKDERLAAGGGGHMGVKMATRVLKTTAQAGLRDRVPLVSGFCV